MSITWKDVMKFDLPQEPIIFDIGGYKGDWVQIAMDNYENPTIYVFEPIDEYFNIIKERWSKYENVKVFNFGLSEKTMYSEISVNGDSSSVHLDSQKKQTIKLKDIREFFFDEGIFKVDLAKVNIEGEEYRLLEYLKSTPELNIIENYLIQFHRFVENYETRRDDICKSLSVYYDRLFNYEFVFEGWKMKEVDEVYCFGDSHVSIFSDHNGLIPENTYVQNSQFTSFRFGPYLAYNLPKKTNVLPEINKLAKDTNLLVCFGEIDCRAQVHLICENTNRSYEVVLDEIVSNYFSVVDNIKINNKIIFSIVPCLKEYPFLDYYKDHPDDMDRPRGSLDDRQEYKRYFNKRIEQESLKRGIKYLSIFNEVLSLDGKQDKYYLDDIHLNPNKVMYLIKRAFISAGIVKIKQN